MEHGHIRILLVENNPLDAHLVQATLAEPDSVEIESVGELREALALLSDRSFDVILLDLSLPDARGFEALQLVRSEAPTIPVVVLTSRDDQSVALQAVREGAQDYLTKERMERDVLLRAVRYAVERHRLLAEIRELSLTDDLTRLYNRHGFFTLGEQQLKLAMRARQRLALFYADLDGLKQINDRLGHREGDRAIRDAADLLRGTFRGTDIQARIGGDEFVVLALDVDAARAEIILRRLRHNVDTRSAAHDRSYRLSLSTGHILSDPAAPTSIEHLLKQADAAMYVRKRDKQGGGERPTADVPAPVLK